MTGSTGDTHGDTHRRPDEGAARPAALRSTESALCNLYDLAVVDLDGTVYVGRDPVPGAVQALADLRARHGRVAFVTNNASRTPEEVAEQLSALGVAAGPDDVVTSAQAAARLLADRFPAGSPVLVVGGAGLRSALDAVGLVPVASLAAGPVAVVQGWTPELDWSLLAEGAYALQTGLPWIATNTDRTLPTDRGTAPGNGSFVTLLAGVVRREPEVVAGKPGVALLRQTAARFGARAPLVVGDRLDTDIEGAVAAGMDSLLVLTGVSTAVDLLAAGPRARPTYVASGLAALFEPQPTAAVEGGTYRVRGAAVTLERRAGPGAAVLDLPGDAGPGDSVPAADWLDLVRAATSAAWAGQDVGLTVEPTRRLLALLDGAPSTAGSAQEGP